jgi:hypothetical protein
MDKTLQMQSVEASELRAVVGGSLLSWLTDAAKWVAGRFGYSGTDMGGNPAYIISVKGSWSGNP